MQHRLREWTAAHELQSCRIFARASWT